MNINKSRILGGTALLAILLGSAACGTETVSDTDPGSQPGQEARIYPPTSVPPAPLGKEKGGTSADSAERRAAADKARQDKASAARYDRGTHNENRLQNAGHPGRP